MMTREILDGILIQILLESDIVGNVGAVEEIYFYL